MKVRASVKRICENCKVVRRRPNKGHLLSTKSGQRKRRLRRKANVSKDQVKTYIRLITG